MRTRALLITMVVLATNIYGKDPPKKAPHIYIARQFYKDAIRDVTGQRWFMFSCRDKAGEEILVGVPVETIRTLSELMDPVAIDYR